MSQAKKFIVLSTGFTIGTILLISGIPWLSLLALSIFIASAGLAEKEPFDRDLIPFLIMSQFIAMGFAVVTFVLAPFVTAPPEPDSWQIVVRYAIVSIGILFWGTTTWLFYRVP